MSDVLESVHHVVTTMLLAVGALLPIVDPLSGAPIYLQFTGGIPSSRQAALARAVAADSFLLLLGSAFAGAYLLDFFGLSVPAVQVAGGIVLCVMGWSLLNKPDSTDAAAAASAAEARGDDLGRRAFYPLTLPLTVGPGSISVAVTLGANPHTGLRTLLATAVGHALGILIVAAAVYFCYRYAGWIVTKLGETGRSVVMRLSSFILLCIGVQIAWNGVQGLIVSGFPRALG